MTHEITWEEHEAGTVGTHRGWSRDAGIVSFRTGLVWERTTKENNEQQALRKGSLSSRLRPRTPGKAHHSGIPVPLKQKPVELKLWEEEERRAGQTCFFLSPSRNGAWNPAL